MKKSTQEMVRRTRGRDTEGYFAGGGDAVRMRWRTRVLIINGGKAVNDAANHVWRIAA
jgi:hypothetical protein